MFVFSLNYSTSIKKIIYKSVFLIHYIPSRGLLIAETFSRNLPHPVHCFICHFRPCTADKCFRIQRRTVCRFFVCQLFEASPGIVVFCQINCFIFFRQPLSYGSQMEQRTINPIHLLAITTCHLHRFIQQSIGDADLL